MATLYEMAIGGAAMVLIGVLRGEPGRLHLGAIDTKGWLALAYLLMSGGEQTALGDFAWIVTRGLPTAGALVLLGVATFGVRRNVRRTAPGLAPGT